MREHSISSLSEWTKEFVRAVGLEPQKLQLSEAHVRCDTPTPFTESDLKLMRGASTRHGSYNTHMHGGKLSGINNLGGSKHVKYCIYDKRLEQKQKEGAFWPAVWKSYAVPEDSPIWRVEARFDRKALTYFGLDALSDLNERTLPGLWHAFSSQYLLFVSRPGKRTDRSSVSRKWKKIQSCGAAMEARPIMARIGATSTQLVKQATGCIAKALAVSGNGHFEAVMQEVIGRAVTMGDERFSEGRRGYIGQMLKEVLSRCPEDAFTGARHIRAEIESLIETALSRRRLAEPFSGKQLSTTGGTK